MKSLDKILNYLIAIVVLAIAGSFFLLQKSPEKNVVKKQLSDQEVNQIVNKHLSLAVNQNQALKIKTEAALREARRKVERDILDSRRKQDAFNSTIPREKQIWNEADVLAKLEQARKEAENSGFLRSPDFDSESSDKKSALSGEEDFDVKSMTPAEKKQYAKQYVENARKDGFEIELNENLEVTKSTPIRKPSKQDDSFESLPTD